MIRPINGHILIEPVKHESFISSDKGIYEEIGMVVAKPNDESPYDQIQIGDKVYFDAWMAAKYPKNDNEYYWLVTWSEIRAIEKNEAISE